MDTLRRNDGPLETVTNEVIQISCETCATLRDVQIMVKYVAPTPTSPSQVLNISDRTLQLFYRNPTPPVLSVWVMVGTES